MRNGNEYEIRITCNEIPVDAKTFGDYKFQSTKGFTTPPGQNCMLFDALDKLLQDCRSHMQDRIALARYLKERGLR